jgi:hypothetical protein
MDDDAQQVRGEMASIKSYDTDEQSIMASVNFTV